jgi:hypothetical protein
MRLAGVHGDKIEFSASSIPALCHSKIACNSPSFNEKQVLVRIGSLAREALFGRGKVEPSIHSSG